MMRSKCVISYLIWLFGLVFIAQPGFTLAQVTANVEPVTPAERMSPPVLVKGEALEVTLLNGLDRDGSRRAITIYARRWDDQREGAWSYAIGFAGRFNSSYHYGRIVDWQREGSVITFTLSMEILPDAWVPGGRAIWQVEVKYDEHKGVWEGTYRGAFRGKQLTGNAHAELVQMRDSVLSASEEQEHPRLLFRKRDLTKLRAKWNTSFGEAAAKRMTNAVGLAFRYQMTGDRALAEEAMEKTKTIMADVSNGSKHIAHRVLGWRIETIALTYDMCYDIWPADFKKEVRTYLKRGVERTYFDHGSWTEYAGWSMSHRFGANYLGSAGIGALVLQGTPGPAMAEPAGYLGGLDPWKALPINVSLEKDSDSVVVLKPGVMPDKWYGVTGLKAEQAPEKLAELIVSAIKDGFFIGEADIGTGDAEFKSKAMDAKSYWQGKLDLTTATGRDYHTTQVLYSTVLNDKQRWVKFSDGFSGGLRDGQIWINGVPINHDDVFLLNEGLYTIVVRVYMTETNPWGKMWIAPRLIEMSEEQAREVIVHRIRDAKERKMDWAYAERLRLKTGADPRYLLLGDMGESIMTAMYRENMGGGGFPSGTKDMNFTMHTAIRYARAYHSMYGHQPDWYQNDDSVVSEGMKDWVPVRLVSAIFDENGKMQVQPINGRSGFKINEWHEYRDTAPEVYAALYPLLDESMKPAVLWAWRQYYGIEVDAKDAAQLLNSPLGKTRSNVDWSALDMHAVMAFVAYPYDAPKTSYGQGMPEQWFSEGWGWFAFRDRYKDENDIVTQFFAKTRMNDKDNRENAGAIRLRGLGHEWISGPATHDPQRITESTLHFPALEEDGGFRLNAPGRLIKHTMNDHGGSVSIDLSELYTKPKYSGNGKRKRAVPVYTQYANLKLPDTYEPTQVKWTRHLGVDYSGKSGTPCVMVIHDQFKYPEKGKQFPQPVWRLPVPEGGKVEGNTYTVKQGDATMRVTVMMPEGAKLETKVAKFVVHPKFKKSKNKERTVSTHVLEAYGEKTRNYLAVITIQRGDAPTVEFVPTGKVIMVNVGKQAILLEDGVQFMP